jgi:uncharacterized protein YggL (DUF469 family)
MNRRLRKKMSRGEYTDWGFRIKIILQDYINDDESIEKFNTIMLRFVEHFDLGATGTMDNLLLDAGRCAITAAKNKEKFLHWLDCHVDVDDYNTSDILDLNNHNPLKEIT